LSAVKKTENFDFILEVYQSIDFVVCWSSTSLQHSSHHFVTVVLNQGWLHLGLQDIIPRGAQEVSIL